jgi:hypothetical protein
MSIYNNNDDSQKNLNIFNIYCEAWKLFINCSKSKVVIFNKRKMKNPPVFTLSDEVIEIVIANESIPVG